MKPNLAPDDMQEIRSVPMDETPSTGPDLYVIQAGGEEAGDQHGTMPELYLVEDPEEIVDEDLTDSLLRRSVRAAGRIVKLVESGAGSYYEDDSYLYKGGGGGWAIREAIRKALAKLAAKGHESGCSCEHCEEH